MNDKKKSSRNERMSSGHVAGLQKAGDFSKAESNIQTKREADAQAMVDMYGMGDTVYRDKSGRKIKIHQTRPSSVP